MLNANGASVFSVFDFTEGRGDLARSSPPVEQLFGALEPAEFPDRFPVKPESPDPVLGPAELSADIEVLLKLKFRKFL